MFKEGESSWIRWIKKRINNNLNFLAIAEGPTGVGKSWAMLSIAHQIDPEFESRQVAFSFKQVMEIINSDWFKKKKWKIIIFDEAQTDMGNRQWQSLTNKLVNFLLSTFRHQNIILLFTSPYSDFIDSQAMKLIHCKLEVRSHDRKTSKTTIRPKLLQYNSNMKKFYYHSLHVIKDGFPEKMMLWKVDKPPKHLIEPYEKDKIAFTAELNKSIMDELNGMDRAKQGIDSRKPLTEKQRIIFDLWIKLKQGQLVAKKLGLSGSSVSDQLILARKKGYTRDTP